MAASADGPGPVTLAVGADGTLAGNVRAYDKPFAELAGVYSDAGAFAELCARHGDDISYHVRDDGGRPGAGDIIIGTSTLNPGRVGREFAMTRGHLHAIADRAELYYGISGHGLLLMETVDGAMEIAQVSAGRAVHVPGNWIHRSVNVGTEPFVTLFCYPADAGQNYGIIERAGGMAHLVLDDGNGGWVVVDNPRHRGYGS